MKVFITPCLVLWFSICLFSQKADSNWKSITQESCSSPSAEIFGPMPATCAMYELQNWTEWKEELMKAPLRFSEEMENADLTLEFPMPDGVLEQFTVVSSPVLQPGIAAAHPEIQTYTATSINHPGMMMKIELTPKGMSGVIFGTKGGTALIHPYDNSKQRYYCFYRKDGSAEYEPFVCGVEHLDVPESWDVVESAGSFDDCQFRQYRLALACTGEFAQIIDDGDDSNGDIVADVLADMVIVTNRLNGIFEREVGVTMVLIDRNEEIIFTDPDTDFYSDNISSLPAENSTVMQITIGRDAFDIGHVFGSRGGGIAFVNGPCGSAKAKGASGRSFRGPDDFVFDIVAHEVGHQFGGRHTQNNDCNRNERSSYEPGSGSTILSYARVCPPLVERKADDYFHAISIAQMREYIANGGGTCPEILDANNTPPIADAGDNYIIPKGTPFILDGSATDAEGDQITYCWEQFDKEFAVQPPSSESTVGPTFRSFPPTTNSIRYVPRLSIVNEEEEDIWEVLPEVGRALNFRLTVRSNNGIFGCTDQSDMNILVDGDAGPFKVITPTGNQNWGIGDREIIRWDVANTNQAPVNCAEVNIFYSIDGGKSFPFTLVEDVPNNGSYEFEVTALSNLPIKFMVRGSGNIFFNVSQGEVSIIESNACGNQIFSENVPLNIPKENPSVVESIVFIDSDEVIETVNVIDLIGSHEFLADVSFSLISPEGTEVKLWGQRCTQTEEFNLSFSDIGTDLECPVNVGQVALPQDPFSNFVGENARGNWTLRVEDNFAEDGGELLSWGLEICTEEVVVNVNNQTSPGVNINVFPNPVDNMMDVSIMSDGSYPGQLEIIDAVGQVHQQLNIIISNAYQDQIDVSNLSQGIYFLRFVDKEGKAAVRKFVKR